MVEEMNEKRMNKLAEFVSWKIKSLSMTPLEALVSLASMSETLGDFYLNELKKKENPANLKNIQIGRLSKTLEDCKLLSLERTKECLIVNDAFGAKPLSIKFVEDTLISNSLKKRFNLLKEANFKCKYCGRSPPEVELELEHIIPRCKGGDNDKNNLAVSCKDCNRGKGGELLN